MRCLPPLLITLILATPAFAVELFRYGGAARDGGTLEYLFDTDQQDVPATSTKEKVAEIAADFMTTFLPHPDRRNGDSEVSHDAGSILARVILGGDPRTCEANIFRCHSV
jgi:hypothetical protein